MFLLRRSAVRAVSSPSKLFITKPRSITTYTSTFYPRQQHWISSPFQRRFASDDAKPAETAESVAAEAETFAQTRPEAPIEDNLTPAQESAQAPPTDASATAGTDALEAAAESVTSGGEQQKPKAGVGLQPAAPNNMVYVGNLYYEVTEDQLKRVFSRFGTVNSIKIVYDNRGLSRGFAYVEFASIDDAKSAVDNLDMQVFEGRNLVVQFHRQKASQSRNNNNTGSFEKHPPSKTLFIGNMSFEMSDKDLNDLFRDIRNVMDVRVAIDRRTGQPRGFAHADFIDVASAARAKEALGEKVIYGRQLRIDFSKSGSQQQRERKRDTV